MIGLIGARGIIGSAIHENLVSLKKEIQIYGRTPISTMRLDLDVPDHITPKIFQDIDTLIYAAGVRDEDFLSDPQKAYTKGTYTTSKLLDAAQSAKVSTFVYISTAHVYGPLSQYIDERTPVFPISDYACAHYISEQIFRRVITKNQKARVLIIRPCAVYGLPENLDHFIRWGLVPYRLPHMAATNGKIILRKGSDQIYRNFVSAQCIANVIADFIEHADPGTVQTINPIGNLDISILGFAMICAQVYKEITGQECPISIDDTPGPIPFAPPLRYSTVHTMRYQQGQKIESFIHSLITRCLNAQTPCDIRTKI